MTALQVWIDALFKQGFQASEVMILVRTDDLVSNIAPQVPVSVMTMHQAKGAEYRAVAVIGLDQDVVPLEDRLLMARDEAQVDEIMNTERHLLYVGATRARDRLWLSGVSPVSEFLRDLM